MALRLPTRVEILGKKTVKNSESQNPAKPSQPEGGKAGKHWRFKDLSGLRYTDLTVVSYLGASMWECKCDCGATSNVHSRSLNSGNSKRCAGHKLPRATGTMSKLYGVWRGMWRRCTEPGRKGYAGYGGRGIEVCQEWAGYPAFRAWALKSGYHRDEESSRKEILTIDRVDNDKGYSPDNCRWVKPLVQARNKREPTVLVEAFGQLRFVTDWAKSTLCRVSARTLRNRLALGYPPEYAMTASTTETKSKSNPYRLPRAGRALSLKVAMYSKNGAQNA